MKPQNLDGKLWRSSSRDGKLVDVSSMPVPYAQRCYAQLEAAHGSSVESSVLGQSLLARIALDGSVLTDVQAFGGEGLKLLRGERGRYVAATAGSPIIVDSE